MTDQQRYDSLGVVGRSMCRTPNLDRLAARGVRFDNAYTVCALCSPARTSMLTGRYPHNHRMWTNNDGRHRAIRDLPDGERLISEYLVKAGYNCGYSGKWHCGHTKTPSTYGFVGMNVPDYGNPYKTKEYADYSAARGLKQPERIHVDSRGHVVAGTLNGPIEACEPHFVAEHALDLIKGFHDEQESTGKPFMAFVSFWGPHMPYAVPEPYASMYDPENVDLWSNFNDDLKGKPKVQERFRRSWGECSEDIWRKAIAKYWGFCTFIDEEIGRLLDALGDMNVADETAILFSTDHGDMLGSHGGFWDKGPFMYEETYHIPMIVYWPGVTKAGGVSTNLVSNMDLAATVLDIAEVLLPENLDSCSLAPLLRDPHANWRNDFMAEFHGHRFLYSQRMVRWGSYKFVFNAPDRDELYDLGRDPDETSNMIEEPEYAEIAKEGRQRLLKWMKSTNDPLEFAGKSMLL
jgi:arylsulfatase A-like enzyme